MSSTDLTLDLIARRQAAMLRDLGMIRDDMAMLRRHRPTPSAARWPGWSTRSTPRICGTLTSIAASVRWRRVAMKCHPAIALSAAFTAGIVVTPVLYLGAFGLLAHLLHATIH